MPRPTKLTPEVQSRFCDAIRSGNYYEAACALAGVDYVTFRRWMNRGAAGKSPFRQFRNAVQTAEAEAESEMVRLWKEQVPGNWQAARDFLARRFPDRWGPKDSLHANVTGKVEHVVQTVEGVSQSEALGVQRNGTAAHP